MGGIFCGWLCVPGGGGYLISLVSYALGCGCSRGLRYAILKDRSPQVLWLWPQSMRVPCSISFFLKCVVLGNDAGFLPRTSAAYVRQSASMQLAEILDDLSVVPPLALCTTMAVKRCDRCMFANGDCNVDRMPHNDRRRVSCA